MLRSALLAAVFAAGFITAASAATMQFHATMNGKSEVPPNQTAGTGDALATLDTTSKVLTYTVTFETLPDRRRQRISTARQRLERTLAWRCRSAPRSPTSPVHGTATLTDAQIKDLEAGKW